MDWICAFIRLLVVLMLEGDLQYYLTRSIPTWIQRLTRFNMYWICAFIGLFVGVTMLEGDLGIVLDARGLAPRLVTSWTQ